MFIRSFLFALFFILGLSQSTQAQTGIRSKPYLVSATINVSVNDQADFWLNGVHIGHYPHTSSKAGYRILEARPDSLCLFKNDNVLAIRLQASKQPAGERYIGAAYFMFLRFSDGSSLIFDSADAGEHKSFYLPHRDREEPVGWQMLDYDDSGWMVAQSSGETVPDTGSLLGGNFGQVPGFLSATLDGYFAKYAGEKHLFRRRFHLDIGVNPRCLPKTMPNHRVPVTRTTGLSSITPVVLPARKEPLAAVPQLNRVRIVPQRRAYVLVPTWTPTPVVLVPTIVFTPLFIPSPTPLVPTPAAIPIQVLPASPTITPFYTPTLIVQDDGAIVFGQSAANILVIFGDGPGNYQVEAVDAEFRHLKTLLSQHIMTSSEMWLSWDGKNEAGQDVPEGKYYILCSKEGAVLQKIILRRVSR